MQEFIAIGKLLVDLADAIENEDKNRMQAILDNLKEAFSSLENKIANVPAEFFNNDALIEKELEEQFKKDPAAQ